MRAWEAVTHVNLRHDAFVYDSDTEFVEQMAPFVRAGFEEGAAAVAVTTAGNWALLQESLGRSAEQVAFKDRDAWYQRPASTIAGYVATLRDLANRGAPSIRVIGEVAFGSTPEEWRVWAEYEAILNRVFVDHPAWILCPYDSRALPDSVVESAWQTHSQILAGGWQASTRYAEPEAAMRAFSAQYEPLPGMRELPPSESLGAFRDMLGRELAYAAMPDEKARDLIVAANEVVANAWVHGGGPTAARLGRVGDRVVFEVSDHGPGFDDPLAGYRSPEPEDMRGAGLWLARQLTWRLDLHSSPGGLTARLWL